MTVVHASYSVHHTPCITRFLDRVAPGWRPFFDSPYSMLYASRSIVVKIRKARSLVAGAVSPEFSYELARREYQRGLIFAPHVYESAECVPCQKSGSDYCRGAVLSRRLPKQWRLDHVLAVHPDPSQLLTQLTDDVVGKTPSLEPLLNGRSLASLRNGDRRIRNILQNAHGNQDTKEVLTLWDHHEAQRESLAAIFQHRDDAGHAKEVHGDIKAANIFALPTAFALLDPCVAFPDMYLLDELADLAGVFVTAWNVEGESTALALIQRVAHSVDVCEPVLHHYIRRIALIRLSLAVLQSDRLETARTAYRHILSA